MAANWVRRQAIVSLDDVIDFKDYMHTEAAPSTTTFRLRAVTVHQGSVGGGHYYMYILHNGHWYVTG